MLKNDYQVIKVLGEDYFVLDVIEHITIPDCFVVKRNKVGNSNGEAKLYLGSRKKEVYFRSFFDNFQNTKAFFLKQDFFSYLNDAKLEYEIQEQGYNISISHFWGENKNQVSKLNGIELFEIRESSAGGKDRYYLENPKTSAYKLFRTIMLPTITYISILKLQNCKTKETIFYFRPFLDYFYDKRNATDRIKAKEEFDNKGKQETKEEQDTKKSRVGQGKYRGLILDEFPSGCLITNINDERLLIASHIKPWVDCDNVAEQVDRFNGLLLSPTYDRLFDQGFITFSGNGVVETSPYISPLNWKKLDLKTGKKFKLEENTKRIEYLEYHKKNIFKG
ncbi:MAG: HNH endonuclease [Alphaproteobacteria bacterium]